MCGIFGFISERNLNIDKCIKSLKLLSHRGPDNRSYTINLDSHLFLAHTRLKIIDLSDSANQPFISNCGNYEIIFNGEIFNYRELIDKHLNLRKLRTSSDTEVLLNLYILYGAEMLKLLNGMFAFAIYDKNKKNLFLARDRFGIKPLYYHSKNYCFNFASEIKPLLFMNDNCSPDHRMVSTYLKTSYCDFSKNTFFESIYQLEAGSFMNINLNNLSKKTEKWYGVENLFSKKQEQNNKINDLDNILKKSINQHCISDVKIGLNISGGVDSSLLITYVNNIINPVTCFTQNYQAYSEEKWIKEIIKNKSIESKIINIQYSDILNNLERTVLHQEQPFGGVAVVGYAILYELSRKLGIKVLLDGNGIDELFLGYKKYHLQYLYENLNSPKINILINDYCKFWKVNKNTLKTQLIKFNSSETYIDGNIHLGQNCISNELLQLDSYNIPSVNLFKDGVRNNAARDLFHTKIPRGLRFNDRMSMMHSCELRVPFLDYKIVEFAFNLPVEELINSYGSKAIVRNLLSNYVNKKIAYAPKRSIQTPQNDWLSKELKPLVLDIINSKSFQERGWFKKDLVKKTYEEYLNGNKKTSYFIWQWINLELWAKQFFIS